MTKTGNNFIPFYDRTSIRDLMLSGLYTVQAIFVSLNIKRFKKINNHWLFANSWKTFISSTNELSLMFGLTELPAVSRMVEQKVNLRFLDCITTWYKGLHSQTVWVSLLIPPWFAQFWPKYGMGRICYSFILPTGYRRESAPNRCNSLSF